MKMLPRKNPFQVYLMCPDSGSILPIYTLSLGVSEDSSFTKCSIPTDIFCILYHKNNSFHWYFLQA